MTILIVDDHSLYRRGFVEFLKQTRGGNDTFIEAANGYSALTTIEEEDIDIIFLDINMPGINGYETAERMLRYKPSLKIIIQSIVEDVAAMKYFFHLGVKGFISKGIDEGELKKAIYQVEHGFSYYPSNNEAVILADCSISFSRFSPRESEVFKFLCRGKTNLEISSLMKIGKRAIESYRESLLDKTHTHNTAELISFVFKNGIL